MASCSSLSSSSQAWAGRMVRTARDVQENVGRHFFVRDLDDQFQASEQRLLVVVSKEIVVGPLCSHHNIVKTRNEMSSPIYTQRIVGRQGCLHQNALIPACDEIIKKILHETPDPHVKPSCCEVGALCETPLLLPAAGSRLASDTTTHWVTEAPP